MPLSDNQLWAISILSREPTTRTGILAKECGVSPQTIRNWRNNLQFKEALGQTKEQMIKLSLEEKAIRGDRASAETYLKWYGTGETQKIDEFAEALNMTEPEIEHVAVLAYEYVRAKRAAA